MLDQNITVFLSRRHSTALAYIYVHTYCLYICYLQYCFPKCRKSSVYCARLTRSLFVGCVHTVGCNEVRPKATAQGFLQNLQGGSGEAQRVWKRISSLTSSWQYWKDMQFHLFLFITRKTWGASAPQCFVHKENSISIAVVVNVDPAVRKQLGCAPARNKGLPFLLGSSAENSQGTE